MDDRADHYATLGVGRGSSAAQIREAYRLLARRCHPDLNSGSPEAVPRTQALNAAYEVLGDEARRAAYDGELDRATRRSVGPRTAAAPITQDFRIGLKELLCGTQLTVRIDDPAHPGGVELLDLAVPPGTAPGTRFRLRRAPPFERTQVVVRVKARPDPRFKARGADLRCDLRISARRAAEGGVETLRSVTGDSVRVAIPRGVERGEIIRIPGEGLPRSRGDRGELLVRILYRPDVRITPSASA